MDVITKLIENWEKLCKQNPDITIAVKNGHGVAAYDTEAEMVITAELVDNAMSLCIIEDSYVIGNTGLDKAWNDVREFQKAFNHPVADKPTFMDKERVLARVKWIQEELQELIDAEDVVAQVDANIDALYFILGNLVEIGVRPQALFEIVQNANMSKLFPDGKPRYDADRNNKIIKPEGWEAPEDKLQAEIERQMRE
ncbi:hypothetical protein SECTIM467_89 [Brevibacillus phage SecTim467]|uniref:HAD family hydrolase n=2 Tax=Jenstvirus jenst TaxID=1982225 RepID=A0A0K2CNN3_9CAUD|nr:hydrolase [Brevibacillus phage Jenst]ALA07213.1 putative haloacid dehalogenase [Brevibacillus phage Jenst]ALA07432.1 hypothetical protein SECTIM467_89 [Brevibacillus phage SecTim467]